MPFDLKLFGLNEITFTRRKIMNLISIVFAIVLGAGSSAFVTSSPNAVNTGTTGSPAAVTVPSPAPTATPVPGDDPDARSHIIEIG